MYPIFELFNKLSHPPLPSFSSCPAVLHSGVRLADSLFVLSPGLLYGGTGLEEPVRVRKASRQSQVRDTVGLDIELSCS